MTKADDTPLQDATQVALDAAQLATEAAHEAEAAIAARNQAAEALSLTARHTRLLVLGTAAGAVLALAGGGVFWVRASSHLQQAAEVQATATAGFVENLMQMNDALDRMQGATLAAQAQAEQNEGSIDALIARLDQRLQALARDVGPGAAATHATGGQCTDLLVALAEVELNLTRQMANLVVPSPPPAQPAPNPVAGPAPVSASASAGPPRPAVSAPRPAPPPPNPFSFP